jgi:hypothetical protein
LSCEQSATRTVRTAARQSGIGQTGGKSGYVAGRTPQVSFFAPAGSGRSDAGKQGAAKINGGPAQRSVFKEAPAQLPTQRQIKISGDFSPRQLQRLSVQLKLGTAATARHIRLLNREMTRGIGYTDPRPLDWAQSDRRQYEFLIGQLDRVKGGKGYIDTSALKRDQVAELWEFARFEADRAHRNIDHLRSGSSHLKGPTAGHLTKRYKLEARFYEFLAGQLETLIPPEELIELVDET